VSRAKIIKRRRHLGDLAFVSFAFLEHEARMHRAFATGHPPDVADVARVSISTGSGKPFSFQVGTKARQVHELPAATIFAAEPVPRYYASYGR
jgi:hypothetical protein